MRCLELLSTLHEAAVVQWREVRFVGTTNDSLFEHMGLIEQGVVLGVGVASRPRLS